MYNFRHLLYPVLGVFLLLITNGLATAQTAGIPLQSPSYPILDRLEIISGLQSPIHAEIKWANRREAAAYASQLGTLSRSRLTARDRADLQYLLADNNEWLPDSSVYSRLKSKKGLFKRFYRTPAHLFELNSPDFKLRINPMLNAQLGRENGGGEFIFQNQRGLELRGEVDQKLFFYTNVVESQARFPEYVTQRIKTFKAIPGAGFFKGYQSQVLDFQDGYDFNVATAYLGFQATRHFGLQIGHGKHFIGNGYRSMFLSDFGAPAFFFKLDTRVWKFHYQNLFLELNPVSQVDIPDGTLLPKKYAAIHYLNYKVNSKLAFGLFEASVFNRSRQFELQYLNPIIFYRTVEGMIGSPDNILLGLDARWNLWHRFQLYGQLMMDELVVAEVFSRSGWWANKWGIQAGMKYINAFGIEHLDLQFEHNRARPYTYAHDDPANSYTHYNQPLAHPLGANFTENILLARWQPYARLTFQGRLLWAKTGDDPEAENWGGNLLLDYTTHVRDYGNKIAQGLSATTTLIALEASWMIAHNLFVELKFQHRRKNSVEDKLDLSNQLFGAGFRLNFWNSNLDF